MKAWLRRRRWWALLALVAVAATGLLVGTALTPDPLQLAFDRVELDMTPEQVDNVLTDCISSFPSISGLRYDVFYSFQSGVLQVSFYEDGRVHEKTIHYWEESLRYKFQTLLNRVRSALPFAI